jgi:signal peptidase I
LEVTVRGIAGFLVAIVGGVAFGAIAVAIAAQMLLGYHVLAVASDSMVPALERGDLIITKPVSIADVREGDVVLFETGEQTPVEVIHRVVSRVTMNLTYTDPSTDQEAVAHDYLLRTRGDANPAVDPVQVTSRNLHGLLWFRVPAVGNLLLGFPIAPIFAGVAATTAVLWALWEFRTWRRRGVATDTGSVPI